MLPRAREDMPSAPEEPAREELWTRDKSRRDRRAGHRAGSDRRRRGRDRGRVWCRSSRGVWARPRDRAWQARTASVTPRPWRARSLARPQPSRCSLTTSCPTGRTHPPCRCRGCSWTSSRGSWGARRPAGRTARRTSVARTPGGLERQRLGPRRPRHWRCHRHGLRGVVVGRPLRLRLPRRQQRGRLDRPQRAG